MKKPISIFSILLILVAFAACGDGPKVDPNLIVLNYDDANQDAPELPAGTYEGGARFLSGEMGTHTGKKLIEVQYYLKEIPRSGQIRIYAGGSVDGPKDLIYNKDVTIGRDEEAWNTHIIDPAIDLDGQELWIVYRFSHDTDLRVLGCDPGPANAEGDWLWDENDDLWRPLRQRSTLDINWNIRGIVE